VKTLLHEEDDFQSSLCPSPLRVIRRCFEVNVLHLTALGFVVYTSTGVENTENRSLQGPGGVRV